MQNIIHKRNFPQTEELEKKLELARYVIGVDLHKKTTAITIFDKNISRTAPVFEKKRVKNGNVLETFAKFDGKKIVVAESAYDWRMMGNALENDEDTTFVIFNPRKTVAWSQASGIKSDGIDATILAYTCLSGGLSRLVVYQPCKTAQERLRWVNFRNNLIESRTRIKNQLKSIIRDYGENPYNGNQSVKPELISKMEDCLLDQLLLFDEQVKKADEEIEKLSEHDPVISLLRSIPGIGPLTAFSLRYKVDDISRFANGKHFASYFGFGIRQRQSGEVLHKGGITKTGNILVRKLLVQGAHVIHRWHPEYFRLYFPSLSQQVELEKKSRNKLTIAVARKLLNFAYFCWKNGTMFSMEEYRERREKQFKENTTQSKSC